MTGRQLFEVTAFGRLFCIYLAALSLAGCSHQVLTFFFTGVPDPNAVQAEESIDDSVAVEEGETVETFAVLSISPQNYFTHGPWANGQCDLCHVPRGGSKFNSIGASGGTFQRLSLPPEKLCIGCHSDSQFNPGNPMFFQHGPVVNGDCLTCHSPHQAQRQFLLLGTSNLDLCGTCHKDAAKATDLAHKAAEEKDCVDCHNPHASQLPMLLRAGLGQ